MRNIIDNINEMEGNADCALHPLDARMYVDGSLYDKIYYIDADIRQTLETIDTMRRNVENA